MARLIDASVFVELERRGQPVATLGADLGGEADALAAITASELLAGVNRAVSSAHRRRRERFIEGILERLPIIPFDLPVARTHARLAAELAAAGQPIGANDLLIAATALTHGYALLTHNLRDFRRVPGLVVRQPGW